MIHGLLPVGDLHLHLLSIPMKPLDLAYMSDRPSRSLRGAENPANGVKLRGPIQPGSTHPQPISIPFYGRLCCIA